MKTKYKLFLLFACLHLLLSGCQDHSKRTGYDAQSNASQSDPAVEEYAVYSRLLDELYVQNGANPIILEEETSLGYSGEKDLSAELEFVVEHMPDMLSQDLLDDFRDKNKKSRWLSNRFNLNVECVILSKEQLSELFNRKDGKDGWNIFLTKYPYQSIITLSQIGFNKEKDKALIYSGRESGGKSGRGLYVFMSKDEKAWSIKYKVNVWSS